MEERKNNTGLIILITVLVMLVLGLVGFIVYDKVINKDDNELSNGKTNPDINESENSAIKQLALDDMLVTTLIYPKHNRSIIFDWEYKNITIDSMGRTNMMRSAYADLTPIEANESLIIYSAEEIERNFKKIFGPDVEYQNGDIEGVDTCEINKYNKNDNTYSGLVGCGFDSVGYIESFSKAHKAEQQGDNIYVYYYVQSVKVRPGDENNFDADPVVYLLNQNYQETTKINYSDYKTTVNDMLLKGEVDTYKWTFKKQSDGKYYFYSGAWEN